MPAAFILNDVSFLDIIQYPALKIEAGRVTFVHGPSGSGKSTLLKLLNATQPPSSGRVIYNGADLETLDTIELRRQVLLVSQTVYLFDGSIRDNFKTYYEYCEHAAPEDDNIVRYLSLCALDFPLETDVNTLSGGERQRVYMAVYLSMHPKVLMLDEPTSALDEQTARAVLTNIRGYCREGGITLIVVSHDPALLGEFAEDVIELTGKGARNG